MGKQSQGKGTTKETIRVSMMILSLLRSDSSKTIKQILRFLKIYLTHNSSFFLDS